MIRNVDLLRKKRKGADEEEELVKSKDISNEEGGSGEAVNAVEKELEEDNKE